MSLENQTILITGSSSGIGMACARLLAKEGAQVCLAARREERLRELTLEITEMGGECSYKKTDVTKPEEVQALVDYTLDQYGKIDVLVNNAGVGCIGKIAEVNPDFARQVFEINWFGPLYCIQAVMPHMKKQKSGHIINVSSIIGKRAVPEIGVYCATKFALHALSDALRLEAKKEGIHVTSFCPGLTETEFSQNQIRVENEKPMRAKFKGQTSEHVAEVLLKAIKTKPREVYLSLGGKFVVSMERISPWAVDQMLKMQASFYGKEKQT